MSLLNDRSFTLSLPIRIALALLSALLVFLSSPGSPLPWLSWFWLLPLGLALLASNTLAATSLALLTATLFWCASIWWLVPALQQFSGVSLALALLLFLPLCVLCALPYAVFGFLYARFQWLDSAFGPWRAAIAMTVVIAWIPSLIPGHPVHSQYRYPLLIQPLDIGGLPLLVFVMSAIQWHLIHAVRQSRLQGFNAGVKPAATALVIFLLLLSYGQWRIETLETSSAAMQELTVGFVQPNLHREDNITALFTQSEQLLKQQPDIELLVWPEFPPAFSVIDNPKQRRETLAFSQQHFTAQNRLAMLVVSGYVYSTRPVAGSARSYYNTSHLLGNGEVLASYNKRTLVPFFEYLPLRESVPIVQNWFPDALRYIPGEKATLFDLTDSIHLIPVICYEVIFADKVREFIQAGGNVIINPVSDTWFGDSPGSLHHLSLALFRSLENRVPLVRAANSGVSAVVQASGKIEEHSLTRLNQADALVATVLVPPQRSFYALYGDCFLYFISLLFLLDAGFLFGKKRLALSKP